MLPVLTWPGLCDCGHSPPGSQEAARDVAQLWLAARACPLDMPEACVCIVGCLRLAELRNQCMQHPKAR